MSDTHSSRAIPIFLSLIVLSLASGCSVTTTSLPPASVQPAPPPQGAVDVPMEAGEFSSVAERVADEIDLYDKEVRCRRGNGSKGAPIICVDNVRVKPDPYLVQVWDVEGLGGKETPHPVVVHWFTKRRAVLQVVFGPGSDGKDCVETQPICNGGHCYAIVRPLENRQERTCKYNVLVDGKKENSKTPGMSVVPCCW